MSWQDVYGHERLVEQFRNAVQIGRLASTFLFVGPPGVGKKTFALQLARALLCETYNSSELESCDHCSACTQVDALTHPDLELVSKPKGRNFIPVETFIGDREHRMRAGLCHNIALKSFSGGRKIAIIDDADFLNMEGANCLLKTLEEPPRGSLIVLIGTSSQKQLPTIRSRCQMIRFQSLRQEILEQLIVQQGLCQKEESTTIAQQAGGSLERARQIINERAGDFRETFLAYLRQDHPDTIAVADQLAEFADAAGKDAAAKRGRLREAVDIAIEFYRGRIRDVAAASQLGDSVENGFQELSPSELQRTVGQLDRSIEALNQIDSNVNQSNLIDCWLDDLAKGRSSQSL